MLGEIKVEWETYAHGNAPKQIDIGAKHQQEPKIVKPWKIH